MASGYQSGYLYKSGSTRKHVYYGDDLGIFHCVKLSNGKRFGVSKPEVASSSPTVSNNKVVFGSTDGNIYCLDAKSENLYGKLQQLRLLWAVRLFKTIQYTLEEAIVVSEHCACRMVSLSGLFDKLKNYVETRPVIANGKVMFGVWDSYFYALNVNDGSLGMEMEQRTNRDALFSAAVPGSVGQ